MTTFALRLQNAADTAPRVRLGDALHLTHDGPLNARTGLRPDGGGAVTVNAGAMTVEVSPFSGWIDGDVSDGQGGYPIINDAPLTLTISDGDATSERVDLIVARVYDDVYDASGLTQAAVEVVAGVPGAGAPAVPSAALPLREVVVPAGTSAGTGGLSSSNLGADRRSYCVAAGGILPVASVTERDALAKIGGQAVYRTDLDTLELWTGGGWQSLTAEPYLRLARGATQSIPNAAYTVVQWDTVVEDAAGMRVGDAAVIPQSGIYDIVVSGGFGKDPNGVRIARLLVNGVAVRRDAVPGNADAGAPLGLSTRIRLAAGDEITVELYQSSGADLLTSGGQDERVELTVHRCGS